MCHALLVAGIELRLYPERGTLATFRSGLSIQHEAAEEEFQQRQKRQEEIAGEIKAVAEEKEFSQGTE